ncbi:target of Myb protein 1-like [Canna indica]|uniref:Target of Myb protein 1-like n=1 Tax=Canna indica TaxID=4628 RepID=A0AAQ3Q2P6_9LILI|nr:target of Myb protein 1-like [Canna indica]
MVFPARVLSRLDSLWLWGSGSGNREMLSSSSTVRVEKATSELLMGPDWTLNMDICDSINSKRLQAKDVIKAVKKRLQHRNSKVQLLALTLLETMVKNCDDYLHSQVVEREILQEMVKIVRKKSDMPVRAKILELLDSWQEALGGPRGKYPQFYWAYAELKGSGVEFPERSPDATLTITPTEHATPVVRHPQMGDEMPSNSASKLDEAMASDMANLRYPTFCFLLSDLAVMRSVMELLSEMLKAVDPNDLTAVKDDVMIDLVDQCRVNQKKLIRSINSIRDEDEELLAQGLELNDNLQGLLAKHDAIASGSPLPAEVSKSPDLLPSPEVHIIPQSAATNCYVEEPDDEDDDFAQLARRNSKIKPVGADSKTVTSGNFVISTGASSMDGASSSASNTLSLLDLPTPVKTATNEQDLIDLLSISLSSNSTLPHTDPKPIHSEQNRSPPSVQQAYTCSPQSYAAVDQVYSYQNNYVASWARTQTHPSPPQAQNQSEVLINSSSAYPPPPWALAGADANANSNVNTSTNPFLSTTHRSAAYTSMPIHHNNSFGSWLNSGIQATYNLGPSGQPTSPQPYVYTSRLFSDLLDLKNSSSGLKTSNPTYMPDSSDQGMLNGRK